MDTNELRKLAAQYLISDSGMSMANLIRKIQLAEGHADCFWTGKIPCEQLSCRWYSMCQQEEVESPDAEQVVSLINKAGENTR
jgi:hypothetical protein